MRKSNLWFAFIAVAVALYFLATSVCSRAQASGALSDAISLHRQGYVEVPASSVRRPEDAGKRLHTNVLIWRDSTPRIPDSQVQNSQPSSTWETPFSIGCVYNLVTQVPGCTIAGATAPPLGGVGAIAIVDAYDDPNAASDLAEFSSYFHLPPANFQVVYAGGSQPVQDSTGGWEAEESLDIEWAHAMAPSANIYLVEASSNSVVDLMAAEQIAGSLISSAGGGVVSNSFGGGEFNGSGGGQPETYYDQDFVASNVVFFVSTGDCPFCVEWPAVSPNVVAVGGTSISRDGSGNFVGESYWDDSKGGGGGGVSAYESIPSYQGTVQNIVGTQRGASDLSSDADPFSGVAIYDSFPYNGVAEGWLQAGGTSLAAPTVAGRAAAVGVFSSTATLQNYIYGEYAAGTAYPTNFNDITSRASPCVAGWNFCAGIGSPLGIFEPVPPPTVYSPPRVSCTAVNGKGGYVTNPAGPETQNGGDAELRTIIQGPTLLYAQCTWSGFPWYTTTSNLTLSVPVFYGYPGYGSANVNGVVYTSSFYGIQLSTIPAGTNLSTLSVTAEAVVAGGTGNDTIVNIGWINIQ